MRKLKPGGCKYLAEGPLGRKQRARINPWPCDHIAHAVDECTLRPTICDMGTMTIFLWAGSEETINEIA